MAVYGRLHKEQSHLFHCTGLRSSKYSSQCKLWNADATNVNSPSVARLRFDWTSCRIVAGGRKEY